MPAAGYFRRSKTTECEARAFGVVVGEAQRQPKVALRTKEEAWAIVPMQSVVRDPRG